MTNLKVQIGEDRFLDYIKLKNERNGFVNGEKVFLKKRGKQFTYDFPVPPPANIDDIIDELRINPLDLVKAAVKRCADMQFIGKENGFAVLGIFENRISEGNVERKDYTYRGFQYRVVIMPCLYEFISLPESNSKTL